MLPFPDRTFDVVLALNVLSSIPDPAHRTGVAAEMTRVLTRDGVSASGTTSAGPTPATTRPGR